MCPLFSWSGLCFPLLTFSRLPVNFLPLFHFLGFLSDEVWKAGRCIETKLWRHIVLISRLSSTQRLVWQSRKENVSEFAFLIFIGNFLFGLDLGCDRQSNTCLCWEPPLAIPKSPHDYRSSIIITKTYLS